MSFRTKALLIAEFATIFVAIPLFLALHRPGVPPFAVLWPFCIYCLAMLLCDRTFNRWELWRPRPLRNQLVPILTLFIIAAAPLTCFVYQFHRDLLLSFVFAHPAVWAILMVLYPVLSVYPQGIIYRVFLMHRSRSLLGAAAKKREWVLIFLSALAFSFMHIVFRNWVAVALTFPGGVIFAHRQLRTRSLFVSSFEHSLFGCFLFTIGLGQYFFAKYV
jgi:uncharacterized protein